MRASLMAGLCLASIVFAAGPSAAQPDSYGAETPQQNWESAFATARDHVSAARQRHDEALAAYENMRHRRKKRGEAKKLILDELEEAMAALPVAERELQDLYETAKSAGVPPGWMRMKSPAAARYR